MQGMNFKSIDYVDLDGYARDPNYAFEQKLDGTRALIEVSTENVAVFSRAGTPLKHSAAVQHLPGIVASIPQRRGRFAILDGEIMFDTGLFHVFDMPYLDEGGTQVRNSHPFSYRRDRLENLLDGQMGPFLRLARSTRSTMGKFTLLHEVRDKNGEGVIVKRLDAPYEPGKRVAHSFKAKIIKTVDAVVMEVERPDPKHGFFVFGLYNEDGHLERLSNCSAIGKPDAQVGDVIEVAYLAWTPGGGLREPRMMRIREDKAPVDCRFDQLTEYSKAII